MQYRRLGKTGLMVSEIGLGGEWLERHNTEEVKAVIDEAEACGINILDCWMSEPNVRSNIGNAIRGKRERWYIQGHLGSTWQNGQYVRTRDMNVVPGAFEDLLARLGTDYIDLGMIHYIDDDRDYETAIHGSFFEYVKQLKAEGKIRHIGMSTHNPLIAQRAVREGIVENLLFSVNPAFDMLPASEDINTMFADRYDPDLKNIDPERVKLHRLCEREDIGITVMKGFAGGRLFDAARSPFGVAMTPVQCIHYVLTKPAVAAIMAGMETPEQIREAAHYEEATQEERDYATVLAQAPHYAFEGQCTYCGHCSPCPMGIDIALVNKFYDLATMQDEVPASVKAHYLALDARASQCIGCQSCEARCPFHVPVAQRMQQTAELFGE